MSELPATCQSSSVRGVYKPAIKAGAPADTPTCTVVITFNLNASIFFGENIYMTGNTTELGSWQPNDALPRSASGYTSTRPLWSFTVELPASSTWSTLI